MKTILIKIVASIVVLVCVLFGVLYYHYIYNMKRDLNSVSWELNHQTDLLKAQNKILEKILTEIKLQYHVH